MDDLLRQLRAADAELAALSDEQLLRFLPRLIDAIDDCLLKPLPVQRGPPCCSRGPNLSA
jgi:hypothetical protein